MFPKFRQIIVLSGVAVWVLAGASEAQTAQPPKRVPEAPAMGGQPNTKPGPKVIAPRANEAQLSRIVNAGLVRVTKEQLGQLSEVLYPNSAAQTAQVPHNVGTVKTALFDPSKDAITFIGVDAGSKTVVLPWSEVRLIGQPHDKFATALTAQQIAAAPALGQQTGNAVNTQNALLGRPVRVSDGKQVGTLADVVFEVKSGKIDYAVIDQGGIHLGSSNASIAVPWSKIKDVTGDKSQPLMLALNNTQLAQMPLYGLSKAQETEGSRAASGRAGATQPPP